MQRHLGAVKQNLCQPYPFGGTALAQARVSDGAGGALGGGDARAYCMAVRILFEALQAHLVGLLQKASQCALLARGLCACVESQDIRHAARFLTPGT